MQLLKLVTCLTLILILLCFIFRLYLQPGQLMFVLMALHILLFIVRVVSIYVFCNENDLFLFHLCLRVCIREAV
jgi:hypothetical protein